MSQPKVMMQMTGDHDDDEDDEDDKMMMMMMMMIFMILRPGAASFILPGISRSQPTKQRT